MKGTGRDASEKPPRVLVVSGEPLLSMVLLTLNHGLFERRSATTTDEAIAILRTWSPQVLIVDVDRDAGEGLALLGRDRDGSAPAIALSRRGDLKTKLEAFDRGAEDIVTVPFSPEELVARLFALLRRIYGGMSQFVPTIRIQELEIDILNRRVRAGSSELELTATEQALLYLLAAHPGGILTREQILQSIWGREAAESNVVDRHVRNLRVKLKNSWRRPRYIATVPGRGYRFLLAAGAPEGVRVRRPVTGSS